MIRRLVTAPVRWGVYLALLPTAVVLDLLDPWGEDPE